MLHPPPQGLRFQFSPALRLSGGGINGKNDFSIFREIRYRVFAGQIIFGKLKKITSRLLKIEGHDRKFLREIHCFFQPLLLKYFLTGVAFRAILKSQGSSLWLLCLVEEG
jgi:hypothetical protein